MTPAGRLTPPDMVASSRPTLYRGGSIYTAGAAGAAGAQALVVDGGHVAWLGTDEAAAGIADGLPPGAVVDLHGSLLAPAFVDPHVHLTATGLALGGLELSAVPSLAAALDAVAAVAARTPRDGVVWGTGWDETAWPERRAPTSAELDRAAGGRALYLARVDVHSAVASSALLLAAGLPVHLDGGWVRLADHDAARRAARAALTPAQREQAQRTARRHAAAHGVASLHECSGPEIGGADDLAAALALTAAESGPRTVAYWGGPVHEAVAMGARPAGDLFTDGTLGSRTAAVTTPYLDAPGEHGHLLLDVAAMTEHLVEATRAGVQAGFHVIGDRAVLAAMEALEAAERTVGRSALVAARHRLEHLEMVPPGVEHRLARLGVVASVQPVFQTRWGTPGQMYDRRVGPALARGMNPLRRLAEAGVPLAIGSDAPVTPLDPWAAVSAAVHHPDPAQALSTRAAFTAATRGGWRAAGEDGQGVLAVGAPATFAVWRPRGERGVQLTDARVAAWSTPTRAPAPGLPDLDGLPPECARTVVDGVLIHPAVG